MLLRIIAIFGVMACVLAALYYVSPSEFSKTNSKKWRDWQTVHTLSNPGNAISAVLERNQHFGSVGFKPIIRVSLYENNQSYKVVWESGEASSPKLTWKNATELIISYEHNLTVNYRPEVLINGVEYRTSLMMNTEGGPHFSSQWSNDWHWSQVGILKNANNRMSAIIEIGENDFTNSAPISRVLLSGEGQEPIEIWSSATETTSGPVVRWQDENTLLISVQEYYSYTFFPSKRINGEIYRVQLQKNE